MSNVYSKWKECREVPVEDPSSTEGVQAKFPLPWLPGMRADFRDIRFSDKNGQALSYWIESKTNFSEATVWVKLPANDSKIFLHYGNGSAVSESDGDAVFEYFENADSLSVGSAPSGWTKIEGSGSLTADNSRYTTPSNSLNFSDIATGGKGLLYTHNLGKSHDTIIVSANLNWPNNYSAISLRSAGVLGPYVKYFSGYIQCYYSGSWHHIQAATTNTWYNVEIHFKSNDKYDVYVDGALCISDALPYSAITSVDSIALSGAGSYVSGVYVDDIIIRKYTATEPTLTLSRKRPLKTVYIDSPAETSFTLPCNGLTLGPVTPTPNDDQFPIPTIAGLTLGPVTPNFRDSMQIPVGGLVLGPATPSISDVIPLPCSGLTLSGGYNLRDTFTLPCDGLTLTAQSPWSEDYTGLDLFNVESLSISRNISDSMWQLSAQIAGREGPEVFQNLNWSAVDAAGKTQHIFAGVITESGRSYAYNGDSINVTAYDYSYYLSVQKVPLDMLVMDLNGRNNSWDDWIEDLLENTGIVEWKIASSGYHENNIQQAFTPKTSKLDAIQKICKLTGFIFYVAPVNTGTEESPVWRAGAYFIDPDDIDDADDGLDLPEPAVITWPDPTLVGIPSVAGKSEERINRVTVRGVDEDGNWFTSVEESPNVTSGEAYPREYYEESANWDTQSKCDIRAQRIYAYFNIGATAINATFIKRFDLRLWQKISFVGEGFDTKITTLPPLRIVSIQYNQALADETVSITCIPDRDLNLLQIGTTIVDENNIDTTESVVSHELAKAPSPVIGTVIAINGNIATVETEDGRTIDVRIVQ